MSNDFRKVLSPADIPSQKWMEQVNKLTAIIDADLTEGDGVHEFVVSNYGVSPDIMDKALELYKQAGWKVVTRGPGLIRITR